MPFKSLFLITRKKQKTRLVMAVTVYNSMFK